VRTRTIRTRCHSVPRPLSVRMITTIVANRLHDTAAKNVIAQTNRFRHFTRHTATRYAEPNRRTRANRPFDCCRRSHSIVLPVQPKSSARGLKYDRRRRTSSSVSDTIRCYFCSNLFTYLLATLRLYRVSIQYDV